MDFVHFRSLSNCCEVGHISYTWRVVVSDAHRTYNVNVQKTARKFLLRLLFVAFSQISNDCEIRCDSDVWY